MLYFEGKWYTGIIVSKYHKKKNSAPYIMIKTDKKVDIVKDRNFSPKISAFPNKSTTKWRNINVVDYSDDAGYLEGFGIEASVNSPRIIFERELMQRDQLFMETYFREMTAEEKAIDDDCPF